MGGAPVRSPLPIYLCSPYRKLPEPGASVHSIPAVPCRVSKPQVWYSKGVCVSAGWGGAAANETTNLSIDN